MKGMYFLTNRLLTGTGENVEFVDSNDCTQNLKFCVTEEDNKVTVLKSEDLFKALRDTEEKTEFLLYIHGFNNQPWDHIFPNAAQLQAQFNTAPLKNQRKIVVIPIIWPCDNDFGIIKDYWDDQKSAEASGKFFARAIGKLMKWQEQNQDLPCMKRIHVMAHSMGGRVLMKSMAFFAKEFGGGDTPYLFKNTFLMAADIPNESLETKEGKHIVSASQKVVAYYANDDLSMPASKISNVANGKFTRRMGHTGPEDWSGKMKGKVLAANCDSFNNKLDLKGHTYFMHSDEMESPAFNHMVQMINGKIIKRKDRYIAL